jgi:hypothetical protein
VVTVAGSPQTLRVVFRWFVAALVCLLVFAMSWWAWEALRLPPAGGDRLGVALAVATVVSAVTAGPLFAWAGREQPGEDNGAPKIRHVVVGEIPREPPAFVERETLVRLAETAG